MICFSVYAECVCVCVREKGRSDVETEIEYYMVDMVEGNTLQSEVKKKKSTTVSRWAGKNYNNNFGNQKLHAESFFCSELE